MTVRLLNLGKVAYLQSQTTYHAVAHAMADSSPDTITLMTPDRPYVCVGYHQDISVDVDLEYCRTASVPVLRRAIGGGTVLLDDRQLFFHCILHRRRAPRRVADLYQLVLGAAVRTYQRLGIDAHIAPPNDIQCAGRKLAGSGAGVVGDAVVVGGSIIFGFDRDTMSRVARCPSEGFRAQVRACLDDHMSSLQDEVGPVDHREVMTSLVDSFTLQLHKQLVPGELTRAELEERERLDAEFQSPEWLFGMRRPCGPVHCVKIASHIYVCRAQREEAGMIADLVVSTRDRTIRDLAIDCSPALPAGAAEALTTALRGVTLEEQEVQPVVESCAARAGSVRASAGILGCLLDVLAHLQGL